MTVYDGVSEVVTIITNNWNSSNTDNIKPNIGKITDYPKELQFIDSKGYILIYSSSENEVMPGINQQTYADISENIRIDIRVHDNESYFNKVKAELKRILYTYRSSGTTNYCYFDLDNKSITNLSNRMRLFFREVRDVGILAYNRNMTS